MRLDDLENAEAPAVETYLNKVRVLRRIAGKLIEFLAQLEDFQKKLWLKKKFVVETNYCITLDRIPQELYPEIIANHAQHEEWIKLFAVDEIKGDLVTHSYNNPLTVDFLKANDKLVLDTKFFDDAFKAKLIDSIRDFDEHCDGLLIHSENYQALNLIQAKYKEQVKCIYIDPPYNTGDDGFIYKDSYPSSTWLTMIGDRVELGLKTLSSEGVFFISIGDEEQEHLSTLITERYGKTAFFSTLIWEKKKKGTFLSGYIAKMKDYIICIAKDITKFGGLVGEITSEEETYPCVNPSNQRDKRIIPPGIVSKYKDKDYYLKEGSKISAGNMYLTLLSDLVIEKGVLAKELIIEGNWRYSQDTMMNYAADKTLYITQDLYLRRIVTEPREKRMRDTLLRLGNTGEANYSQYDVNDLGKFGWGTNEDANDELHQLLGEQYAVSYPKPSKLLLQLFASVRIKTGNWVDYFAGSGTTGHAVLNLNREDGGDRKYVLVEMGNYFDTVLKPRMEKVVYSRDWKDGKPVNRHTGISQCIKYLRLESYEDTLNNLVFSEDTIQDKAISNNPRLKEDHMLHYMLDVETRGSSSLLNVDAFDEPDKYQLEVKKPGSDEYIIKNVDLLETFNYLIGLRVEHVAQTQRYQASFTRMVDPELPGDRNTKLVLASGLEARMDGKWWFRKVEGWVPRNPYAPNDGLKDRVLVIWRNRTDNLEEDNLVLNTWFELTCRQDKGKEYNIIYVNGSSNLQLMKRKEDHWEVYDIEGKFFQSMWETEDV
ncbi:MAG TPA: site-specific DNA-methyltransferase [Candidatus Cloacimonadota bacterium]|nr:site-specific DNA-methyltransferase [Candidatus Cloacimonadota bacterium]HPT70672.1 site-specific DNA-methyltransferase [Candidatus Cloacimonadota bacterium]